MGTFWVTLGVCREYSLLEIHFVVGQTRHPHHARVLDLHRGHIWVTLGVCREFSLSEIHLVVGQTRHAHHARILDLYCGHVLTH